MFFFFFVSGFCSILYEIIWLRLAMAGFGVTSALVSIVLSTFMAGLGLGAWGSGQLIKKYADRLRWSALRLYALTELLIDVSAVLVPYELTLGRKLLIHFGLSSSTGYYLVSGAWIGLALIPWCACMGATIPVAMLAIKQHYSGESNRSFSYLYLANVLGASLGTVLPLILIELRGFHGTLKVGATLNALLALTAVIIARQFAPAAATPQQTAAVAVSSQDTSNFRPLALLFLGGLSSMAAEVVWVRLFTPYVGTVVYAFAAILGVYLIATFVGSHLYRRWSRGPVRDEPLAWALVGLTCILPLLTADPWKLSSQGHWLWQTMVGFSRVALGVAPFSALLGFVTPMLVDRCSGGHPDRAGNAYAVNVVGCILGPLLSGFVLLPLMGERWVLLLFSLPWVLVGLYPSSEGSAPRRGLSYAAAAVAIMLVFVTRNFEDQFPLHRTLRDDTATVVAVGEGMNKRLLVNGRGMTGLTPITKMMAHLPLASLDHTPQNGLVICFGMGTSYRSVLSWGISATAVELVPSVPRLFSYYHADASELLSSPLGHVEIDNGRRFVERNRQQYDVVLIDPPPPVQAAGSSLLYSKEFYSTVRQRLNPGGILQQWLPAGDEQVQAAVALALSQSFSNLRVFHGIEGWGFHFLASDRPIAHRTATELLERMPQRAIDDMMEWGPYKTPERQLSEVLDSELPLDVLVAQAPQTPAMQDDLPINEYFLLRVLRRGQDCRNKGISAACNSPTF
jgi:predicted membrane-bound spermidine synthase